MKTVPGAGECLKHCKEMSHKLLFEAALRSGKGGEFQAEGLGWGEVRWPTVSTKNVQPVYQLLKEVCGIQSG